MSERKREYLDRVGCRSRMRWIMYRAVLYCAGTLHTVVLLAYILGGIFD
jgi:hypothetical protein